MPLSYHKPGERKVLDHDVYLDKEGNVYDPKDGVRDGFQVMAGTEMSSEEYDRLTEKGEDRKAKNAGTTAKVKGGNRKKNNGATH